MTRPAFPPACLPRRAAKRLLRGRRTINGAGGQRFLPPDPFLFAHLTKRRTQKGKLSINLNSPLRTANISRPDTLALSIFI